MMEITKTLKSGVEVTRKSIKVETKKPTRHGYHTYRFVWVAKFKGKSSEECKTRKEAISQVE